VKAIQYLLELAGLHPVSRRWARLLRPAPNGYDVLARIADQAMSKLDELLPWNWDNPKLDAVAA
jgi:hypothetical protein